MAANMDAFAHARLASVQNFKRVAIVSEANSSHIHIADRSPDPTTPIPTNYNKADTMMSPQCPYALRDSAKTAPMDCGSDPEVVPQWLDMNKFKVGQAFYRKYFFSVVTAALCGLLVLFAEPVTVRALSYTGRSSTRRQAFKRYLSTLLHVDSWYRGRVWDSDHPARRSLLAVRQVHARVERKMSAQGDHLLREAVSQYGMYLTQFGFMGFVALRSVELGIRATPQELEGFIHFWRGIGYLLGIEDKYNICSSTLEATKHNCQLLVDEVLRPSQHKPPAQYDVMSRALVEGLGCVVPGLEYVSFRAFTYDLLGFCYKFDVNYNSRYLYKLMKLVFRYLLVVPMCRVIFNSLLRLAISLAFRMNPDISSHCKSCCHNNNYSVSS